MDGNDLSNIVSSLEMPDVDVSALLLEDQQLLASNSPLRFAYGFEVTYNLQNSGRWETLPNGDRVWRLRILCPGALNINFLYDDFYIPPGGELYIYNEDQSQILGAYTSENNRPNRKFATALVNGDVATLEYYEPASVAGDSRIQLSQVAHGYRNLDGTTIDLRAGPCQVNVNCPEGDNWQDEKKGVARIIMDGLFLCSGSLVNNTANDCTPYFLTANHCLDGGIKQDAVFNPDVSGYIFYWNYEFATCDGVGPLPEQTTQGGTVVANALATQQYTLTSSDFALIRLAENPRDRYDVYFNGWDATGDPGETGVGIHHPAGDDKKISTHSQVPVDNGFFWDLFWDATENGHSVTEGGSSGSPLFRENGLIIGQLFGGSSLNCDDPANDLGKYGKLSYSWDTQDALVKDVPENRELLHWLDPIGQGSIRTLAGAYDPCALPKVYLDETALTVNEGTGTTATSDGCRTYQDVSIPVAITPFPGESIAAALTVSGDGTTGPKGDYEVLMDEVTFNNVTNQGAFQIRIYDDADVENAELLELAVSITNGQAGVLATRSLATLTIQDDEQTPSQRDAHVQSVSNSSNPAEVYLGAGQTVFFYDPGTGGVMARIQNLSDHDFGCTRIWVDRAGANADNSWENGSIIRKTLRLDPSIPNGEAMLEVALYYTNSELNGWSWFNTSGSSISDLRVLSTPGALRSDSEGQVSVHTTTAGTYGSDAVFAATISGDQGGLGVGDLSPQKSATAGTSYRPQVSTSVMRAKVAPNPFYEQFTVRLEVDQPLDGSLIVRDLMGRALWLRSVSADRSLNERVDLSQVPTGLYVLQVVDKEGDLIWAHRIQKL